MNRRTLLTISTAACLSGLFEAYALILGPYLTPLDKKFERPNNNEGVRVSSKPRENREQAEKYLSEQTWAADAWYQLHTDEAFVYAQEWNKIQDGGIEETGKVRFQPFAMIWRPANHDPAKPPYTVICESALIEFADKFSATNPNPGRVIGGALEGMVKIRGPDGFSVDGQNFIFSEDALRIWSDHAVAFTAGLHRGRGQGVELDLISEPSASGEDKPAVAGVRTIRLRRDVAMELIESAKEVGKQDQTVHVNSAGSFEYDVEGHVASFQNKVRVERPTGNGQIDRLTSELLTLVFEPNQRSTEGVPNYGNTNPAQPEFGSPGGNLTFRRLRAAGARTTLVSPRAELDARMTELTYDAESRVIVLGDPQQVRLRQRNNELVCPEITAMLNDANQIERAVGRGAGKLFSYAKPSPGASRKRDRNHVELAGEWTRQLKKELDPQTGLDLIEFEGDVVLSQTGKMAIQAETVRLWVTPQEGQGETRGGDTAPRDKAPGEPEIQPRRMLALRQVAFASPQITGQTDRLEVWFDPGTLAEPESEKPKPVSHTSRVPRPDRDSSLGQNAAKPVSSTSTKSPENPLHVKSSLIRVRAVVDGERTEIAEIITEGQVQVGQDHESGTPALDLTGHRLHLWNHAADNQVIHLEGTPAQIQDRGMTLEGTNIHFDRGKNVARVDGAGVLRLPVKNGLDGKSLAKPQLLDIFWQEQMVFDGLVAKFYANVRTQLEGNEMRCEEMLVTLAKRVSFAGQSAAAQNTDIKRIACRDDVVLKGHEYVANRLVEVRTAKGYAFSLDQTTGNISAEGPGTLMTWRRGTGKRAGLGPGSGVKANSGLAAESAEWEYTRIDFSGGMQGNSKEFTTTFKDRVRVVYGPVQGSTDVIDEDKLPKDGGWMRGDELQVTQQPATKSRKAYIELLARGNAELDGRSFHALFDNISYDESKGRYVLSAVGDHTGTLWYEAAPGTIRESIEGQRMEFNPSKNELKLEGVVGGQGSR